MKVWAISVRKLTQRFFFLILQLGLTLRTVSNSEWTELMKVGIILSGQKVYKSSIFDKMYVFHPHFMSVINTYKFDKVIAWSCGKVKKWVQ